MARFTSTVLVALSFSLASPWSVAAKPDPAPEPGVGVCKRGESVLTLRARELREWPGGRLLKSWEQGTPLSLACDDMMVVVGFPGPKGGRLEFLVPGEPEWEISKRVDLRSRAEQLAAGGGRAYHIHERRGDFALWIVDPNSDRKPLMRALPARPSAIAMAPSGAGLFLAVGSNIRSFELPEGYSREVFPFPEEITALATMPLESRVLVAQGPRLVAVDLDDTRTRGSLPVRASVELSGTIVDIAWIERGRSAVALTAEPATLVVLDGAHLLPTRRTALAEPADALAIFGDAGVAVVRESKPLEEVDLDALERVEFVLEKKPRPAPPAAVAEPAPAKTEPARVEPEPKPQPKSLPKAQPPTEPAPPSKPRGETVERVPPAPKTSPAEASPPAEAPSDEPSETAAATPLPKSPAPVKAPAKASTPAAKPKPVTPAIPAAPRRVDPLPEEKVAPAPPEPREPAPTPKQQPEPQPKPQSKPQPEPAAPPAQLATAVSAEAAPGELVVELTGRVALVAEVVILGPNSVLAEHSRLAPERIDEGRALLRVKELAPGSYRVVPMGPGGSSLASSPSFAGITIEEGQGARASFTIVRRR